MDKQIPWQDRVRGAYASLRPSERKVAEYILAHGQELEGLTIGALARGAGVSEPTVIRCVRGLGYGGFRAFKQAVKGPGAGAAFDHLEGFALGPWERIADLPLKAVGVQRAVLEETLKSLVPGDLERAARTLAGARRIDLYGVENSSAPLQDLLTKLTYLGLPCVFHPDPYLQQISACHLGPGDAALAFSRSGRSSDTVRALRLAQKAGADTIAVTGSPGAPLEKYAGLVLPVGGGRQTVYGSAIFSRVADLAVADLLYMAVLLSDYPRFSQNLDRSGRVIAHRGLPEEKQA